MGKSACSARMSSSPQYSCKKVGVAVFVCLKPHHWGRDRHFTESSLASQSRQRLCFQFNENLPQGVRQGAMKEDIHSDLGKCTLELRCSVLIAHLKTQIHTQTHNQQKIVNSGCLFPQITLQRSPYDTFNLRNTQMCLTILWLRRKL